MATNRLFSFIIFSIEKVMFFLSFQSGDQALPFRSAFKDVIFRNTGDVEVEKPLGGFENKSDQDGNHCLFRTFLTLFSEIL